MEGLDYFVNDVCWKDYENFFFLLLVPAEQKNKKKKENFFSLTCSLQKKYHDP